MVIKFDTKRGIYEMAKKRRGKGRQDLNTRSGRLAYAQFSLRAGMLLPGEKEAAAALSTRHPPEVEAAIIQLLRDIDCNNPGAFLDVWPPEEIILELTIILVTLNGSGGSAIRNPAGLLWANLSARYPKAVK